VVLLKADTALDKYLPIDTTITEADETTSKTTNEDSKGKETDVTLKSLTVRALVGAKPLVTKVRGWGPIPRIEKEITSRFLYYKKRVEQTNNKVVQPKIVSIQEQLKTQYEKFEAVAKVPVMKKRAKACTSQLGQLKSLTQDYVSHRPMKKIPADTFKFAYQMPLFVVSLLLGTTAKPTDFPEVENLGIGLFQTLVALLFWFRDDEASEDVTIDVSQVDTTQPSMASRPSPASSFDSIASGSEQSREAPHQKQKSSKKKRRAKHGKHKKGVTPSQGSEPDMTKYHSDDEVVNF
jgi:hypothetical protein